MSTTYDVYVSHNGIDKPIVERLCYALLEKGLRPYFDKWDSVPGSLWVGEIEQVVERAPAFLVCVGEHGWAPWQENERQLAVILATDSTRVVPVLLPGASPAELPPFLRNRTPVDLREETAWAVQVARLTATLTGRSPAGPWKDEERTRPYRGLEPFTAEDAGWMFGREQEEAELIRILRDGQRFVPVVGASGSGKSSLVQAGVVPTVCSGGIDGRPWHALVMRPGSSPCEALARRLLELQRKLERVGTTDLVGEGDKLKELRARLRTEPTRLAEAVDLLLDREGHDGRLLLVVDQLEELFTEQEDEPDEGSRGDGTRLSQEGAALLHNLLHATRNDRGRVWVIVTVRADFMGECLAMHELAIRMRGTFFALPPMEARQLREVIRRPALRVGCDVEQALVDALVRATEDQPGRLPLLQHALDVLWNARQTTGGKLTYQTYLERVGTLEESVAKDAERVFGELTGKSAELELVIRHVFLRLVHLGDGARDTRRQVLRSELAGAAEATVLDAFIAVRLLVSGSHLDAERKPVLTVELAHEALLNRWGRLKRWLDESRDARRLRQEVTPVALEWKQRGYPDDELWRGRRLERAWELLTDGTIELLPWERSFLTQSRREERNAELARTRQSRSRLVTGLAVIMVLALALWGAIEKTFEAQELASENGALAKLKDEEARAARKSAQEAQGARALLLADVPNKESEAIEAVIRATSGMEWDGYSRAHLMSGMKESVDRARRVAAIRKRAGRILAAEWTTNARWLATGGLDGNTTLWDGTTGEQSATLQGHLAPVVAVKWSADGTKLASASEAGTVGVWRRGSGSSFLISHGHGGPVSTMAWSHDGNSLATGDAAGTVRIWNGDTSEPLGAFDLELELDEIDGISWGGGNAIVVHTKRNDLSWWNWDGQKASMVLVLYKEPLESIYTLSATEAPYPALVGSSILRPQAGEVDAWRSELCSLLAVSAPTILVHQETASECGWIVLPLETEVTRSPFQ